MARHLGYNQSTIARWGQIAARRGYDAIPTRSSRPKTSPRALFREIVRTIVKKRTEINRSGQVVHQLLLRDGVKVSLSSVQRTLERSFLLKKRSPWKRPHDAAPRPEASFPGALIQVDTIHILAPDGSRIYLYTLIDLYARWAYAEVMEKIGAEASVVFLKHAAQKKRPFRSSWYRVATDRSSPSASRIDSLPWGSPIDTLECGSLMTMRMLSDLIAQFRKSAWITLPVT